MIELNDLLAKADLDPSRVLVMRHRPTERALREALPTMAAERHPVYNAYQCQHSARTENALSKASHLASFIGHEAGKAMFVGVYEVAGWTRIDRAQYERIPEMETLASLGCRGPTWERSPMWFDLRVLPLLAEFKGRLVVEWPGIERAWWRWAERNRFLVRTIHEESRLVRAMPAWNDLVLDWSEINLLPESWRRALSQWRGVYYIFDTVRKLGYVGSASGDENLLGRWQNYAASGHGGNRLLRQCEPNHFVFSILERVSPDMDAAEVVAVESQWKRRLHTRAPFGLNDN
ncbi:GIY-YIG nuclease family protein [Lysobacter sp. cf310]|uniref:GIY-YIG nuclease family protein n=1 Tax=Lysobacter sp. cf310 TaxID=1761790 RepID=UPI0008F23F3A|nr:GIY-YIG nuclease family protein [Lysobacter sp. cf310]SFL30140.1 GIY-YIG catalytic domain-containing protein [Lysobacter sp. cf310]